jgi:hypothetical protein
MGPRPASESPIREQGAGGAEQRRREAANECGHPLGERGGSDLTKVVTPCAGLGALLMGFRTAPYRRGHPE